MNQKESILKFVKDSSFHMVKYENKNNEEFGKILEDINDIDISKHEIHRSIDYTNGNVLFVHDLKPQKIDILVDNPIQLLIKNLKEASVIELVYPDIFTWVFDGLSVKGMAIIPSGVPKSNTTITRYGGTLNFVKILNQDANQFPTQVGVPAQIAIRRCRPQRSPQR